MMRLAQLGFSETSAAYAVHFFWGIVDKIPLIGSFILSVGSEVCVQEALSI